MKKKASDIAVGDVIVGLGTVTQVMPTHPDLIVIWWKKKGVTNDLSFMATHEFNVKDPEG